MNWAWIAFLVTIMILQLLFLVVLIVIHTREGTAKRNWKSSSPAVLFCSVDDRIRQSTTTRELRDDIFEAAGAIRAKLVEDDSDGMVKFVSGDGNGWY